MIVPRAAGTLCAFGMTVTDIVHDTSCSYDGLASQIDPAALADVSSELEAEALGAPHRQGFKDPDVILERSLDVRYPWQVHELVIDIERSETVDLVALAASFDAEHSRTFAYSRPELELESLHCRVRARGIAGASGPLATSPADRFPGPVAARTRAVHLADRGERAPIPVYDADVLHRASSCQVR